MNKLAELRRFSIFVCLFEIDRKRRLKRFFTFSTVVWLLAIAAVFFLIAVPPLQDAWAYLFWKPVPCKVTIEEGKFRKFLYNYGNCSFNSIREDFWVRNKVASWEARKVVGTEENFDQTCYISPGNPYSAVLNLTAHKQWWGWDRGGGSLFLSGFVICVATALALVSHIRRKAVSVVVQVP
ncbi:MAG: hypothetical protein FWD61_06215 [Phycisphaerales bacterium]|nr:hypothetical protein [Phycisphaerales bacterium]